MKLAILAQTYLFDKTSSINGTVVQLHNLSVAFAKKGIEVHYICSTSDKNKPTTEIQNHIHFHWIQAQGGILEWKRQIPLYEQILEQIHPNAVYVRGRNVLQYVAGKFAQKKQINYVWGTNGDDSAAYWKNYSRLKKANKSFIKKGILLPFKIYEDFYINKGMNLAHFVVNQSLFQQEQTLKNLDKKGVILPSYYLKEGNEEEKKNQILWFATLSDNKQPELFIEMINNANLLNWDCILAGGGLDKKLFAKVKKMAENSAITITGEIKFRESFKYYQQSKIFINTSKREGLPNAFIQSWLSGTPVLSLNVDPNNWLDEKQIGYCAKGSVQKLKEKLEELIKDPKKVEEMGNRAKIFAEEQFSNNTTIEAYINLFKGNGHK